MTLLERFIGYFMCWFDWCKESPEDMSFKILVLLKAYNSPSFNCAWDYFCFKQELLKKAEKAKADISSGFEKLGREMGREFERVLAAWCNLQKCKEAV